MQISYGDVTFAYDSTIKSQLVGKFLLTLHFLYLFQNNGEFKPCNCGALYLCSGIRFEANMVVLIWRSHTSVYFRCIIRQYGNIPIKTYSNRTTSDIKVRIIYKDV